MPCMRTLILLRHGKAVRENEAPSDRARPLTDRGHRDAAEAGRRITAADLAPDVVLVSTAVRTRETAEEACAHLAAAPVQEIDWLYMADVEAIWSAFAEADARRVLIVGHNPGLSDLAGLLIAQASDGSKLARDIQDGLSTAAFAAFEIHGDILEAAAPRLLAGWRPA